MKTFQVLGALLGAAGLAQAHMEMIYPPPLKSKANPFAGSDVDYSMTSPLLDSGANFPCKGYLNLLGTQAGGSVATWNAGESYNMTITGGANHGGGSCQAALSYDQGKTWSVIHSYEGDCPGAGTTSLDFKVPSDAPSGEAVFAWTWFNKIGNREMYMNCASITVKGSGSSTSALSKLPSIFVANVGNGCKTLEGGDLKFPNPGSALTDISSNLLSFVGDSSCPFGAGGDSPSGGDKGSGSAPSAPASAPAPSSAAYTQPAAKPTSVPGGVFITVSEPAGSAPTQAPEAPKAPETPAQPPAVSEPAIAPSAPAPSALPASKTNTFLTLTRSAPAPPASSAPATPVPSTPGAGSGSGSGSGDSFAAGTACDSEGDWNCISSSKFQRCASGQWSPVMSMAQGTTCQSGQSKLLSWGKKRHAHRRHAHVRI